MSPIRDRDNDAINKKLRVILEQPYVIMLKVDQLNNEKNENQVNFQKCVQMLDLMLFENEIAEGELVSSN